ncbi:MAG TPA: hypothetical protein VFI31_17670 [Pirellulales bacterium]|nr:hypothetical protein [Pirellulales bacterium]
MALVLFSESCVVGLSREPRSQATLLSLCNRGAKAPMNRFSRRAEASTLSGNYCILAIFIGLFPNVILLSDENVLAGLVPSARRCGSVVVCACSRPAHT